MAGWNGVLGLTGVWPSAPLPPALAGWRSHLALSGVWIDGAVSGIGEGAREAYPRKRFETEEEELIFLISCAYKAGYLN